MTEMEVWGIPTIPPQYLCAKCDFQTEDLTKMRIHIMEIHR